MKRPQRRRIFIGCEGESERGYATRIAALVEERRQDLHLDSVPLAGGDPLAIVQRAIKLRRQRISQRADYNHSFVFLDQDRVLNDNNRYQSIVQLAIQKNINLIWQNPCHEALLLRHLPDCDTLRPPTSAAAIQALVQRWPEYRKPMNSIKLADHIDQNGILRAAAVEPDLEIFLNRLGYI